MVYYSKHYKTNIVVSEKLQCDTFSQIIKKWHERNLLLVRDLMEGMVEWHREGYIDPAVWEKLIRNKVNPALMPAPSVLQSLPLPPGGAGHSALQRLPHPPEGARHPLELQYTVNYFNRRYCSLKYNLYEMKDLF